MSFMPHFHVLTIASVDRSANGSAVIHFQQPPFGRIHYLPGQYVTLRLERDGQIHFRSYSLCSSPRLDNRLSIGVTQVEGGLISNYLVDQAQPGMELEVMEPRGRFYIDNSVKENRQVVLLGGGSGLTPLFAMLRSTLFNEPNSSVTLLMSQRKEEEMLFRNELHLLQKKFSERFHCQIWLSGMQGRVQPDQVQRFIEDTKGEQQEQVFFLCGPEGLMDVYRESLSEMGIPPSQIHQEHFTPNQDEKERRKLVNGQTRRVRLELRGEEYEFSVPPGTTILDAAMDRGIAVPHSCKQGTCASCLSSLESGSVVMAREDALLDFERARGKVLACQAQPTSKHVLIRFT